MQVRLTCRGRGSPNCAGCAICVDETYLWPTAYIQEIYVSSQALERHLCPLFGPVDTLICLWVTVWWLEGLTKPRGFLLSSPSSIIFLFTQSWPLLSKRKHVLLTLVVNVRIIGSMHDMHYILLTFTLGYHVCCSLVVARCLHNNRSVYTQAAIFCRARTHIPNEGWAVYQYFSFIVYCCNCIMWWARQLNIAHWKRFRDKYYIAQLKNAVSGQDSHNGKKKRHFLAAAMFHDPSWGLCCSFFAATSTKLRLQSGNG